MRERKGAVLYGEGLDKVWIVGDLIDACRACVVSPRAVRHVGADVRIGRVRGIRTVFDRTSLHVQQLCLEVDRAVAAGRNDFDARALAFEVEKRGDAVEV